MKDTVRGWNPAAFDRWLTTEPERACDYCGSSDECADRCECPDCESNRAADDQAETWQEIADENSR